MDRLSLLSEILSQNPNDAFARYGLAMEYSKAGEVERALGLRPSSTEVLNNLGVYYAKRKDYARALDYWNRSLSIQPQQALIRQAAEAARSRL